MLLIALFIANFQLAATECTFPAELSGSWVTSTLSTLTFNTTHMGPMFTENKDLECFYSNGTTYVARSSMYVFGPAFLYDYTCIDFIMVSDTKFKYHERTAKNPSANDDRKVIYFNNTEVDVDEVCSLDPPVGPGRYSFMVKEGTVNESVVQNPVEVLGVYNVTLSGCAEYATLDACTNPTRFDFNFSACDSSNNFNDEQIYHALHYETNNDSLAYITVYIEEDNPGDANPFIPLSCLVAGNTSITLAPGDCQDGQTDVIVSQPGVTMVIDKIEECTLPTTTTAEPTTESTGRVSSTVVSTASTTTDSNNTVTSASTALPDLDDPSTTTKNPSGASHILASVLSLMIGVSTVAMVI